MSEKDILVLRLDLTDRSSHEAATNSVLKHFGKVRRTSGLKLFFSSLSPMPAFVFLFNFCSILW